MAQPSFLQLQTQAGHGSRPASVGPGPKVGSRSNESVSTLSSSNGSQSPKTLDIVRCSRCQRTLSIDTKTNVIFPQGAVRFGTNSYYCSRCASVVGFLKWPAEGAWRTRIGWSKIVDLEDAMHLRSETTGRLADSMLRRTPHIVSWRHGCVVCRPGSEILCSDQKEREACAVWRMREPGGSWGRHLQLEQWWMERLSRPDMGTFRQWTADGIWEGRIKWHLRDQIVWWTAWRRGPLRKPYHQIPRLPQIGVHVPEI